jgi:hypothetical protein
MPGVTKPRLFENSLKSSGFFFSEVSASSATRANFKLELSLYLIDTLTKTAFLFILLRAVHLSFANGSRICKALFSFR